MEEEENKKKMRKINPSLMKLACNSEIFQKQKTMKTKKMKIQLMYSKNRIILKKDYIDLLSDKID